jgi:hypothetical protein
MDGASTPTRPTVYALSLKQPWAALLASGRKTVEVRRWSTLLRGRVLIHAAKVSDDRGEVWSQVPAELRDAARRVGGIVGAGELKGCITYSSPEEFGADRKRHWNDPSWFQGPVLYGFEFTNLEELPFRPFSGWMRFFQVPG